MPMTHKNPCETVLARARLRISPSRYGAKILAYTNAFEDRHHGCVMMDMQKSDSVQTIQWADNARNN